MNRRGLTICMLVMAGLCMAWASGKRMHAPDDKTQASRKQFESRVNLLHVDSMFFDDRVSTTAQFLVGNVQFEHDGILMYCDSALYYEASNSFDAYGNVRLVQGDTLTLDGDILYYNGMDQLARVRQNVVLTHINTVLYTDSLDYDRLYNLGYFFEGGRLLDQGNELTSDWGEYNPATRDAVFNYNVRLVNPAPPAEPKSVIVSDTLYYNTRTAIAHVVGPSNIDNGDSHIYSELGYYDTHAEVAYLLQRSILTNNGKRLVGDSVVWEGQEKQGKAFGNIEYTDVVNKNMFTGHYCFYADTLGYMEAADSAVIMDYSQHDTLYAHADSFRVYTYFIDTDSAYRTMHAYRHVRAYRTDIQAVCDSMVYNTQDSCLTMYRDPILWQQGQQLVGEEIKAFMNDSTVDSVHVLRQALSVERLDSIHYNQVAGKAICSYFRDGQIYLTTVTGNVMLNYYPIDEDSLMIGMNHLESTDLKLFMKDRKVDRIWVPTATGTLTPVPLIPPKDLYLDNFVWFDYVRPLNKDDIFQWRPKKQEAVLKESRQRVAPLQKLGDRKKTGGSQTAQPVPEKPAKEEPAKEVPEQEQ